jgi:hypothetical protein
MSPATAGLSTEDVESIRASLEAGRHPRVQFTGAAGQIAGQFGQVVELTDPAGEEDFLVVRFGRDELPFSPADLAIPARGAVAAKAASAKAAKASTPISSNARQAAEPPPGPPLPSPREEKIPMPTSKSAAPAAPAPAAPVAAAPAAAAAAEDPAAKAAPAPRKATKQARPKAPAGLTVTLAYTEGEWTVAAQQGTRALAKPYVIKPTEALKMVALLDVPGVHEAVEAIVSSERAEAQHHAERLRAQLAEIEAKLAELGVDS